MWCVRIQIASGLRGAFASPNCSKYVGSGLSCLSAIRCPSYVCFGSAFIRRRNSTRRRVCWENISSSLHIQLGNVMCCSTIIAFARFSENIARRVCTNRHTYTQLGAMTKQMNTGDWDWLFARRSLIRCSIWKSFLDSVLHVRVSEVFRVLRMNDLYYFYNKKLTVFMFTCYYC